MDKGRGEGVLKYLNVLYVEDDALHREQLASYLKRRVQKLYLAENGEDGLTKVRENSPDLIVTDLKMPGMDGIQMAREIRSSSFTCPIIITSALSDVEVVIQAVDVGIDKYVLKPINTDELIEAMEKIAEKVYKEKFITSLKAESVEESSAQRKEMEMRIKNELARFIKENTGKGPKKVTVLFEGAEIKVKIFETLTLFEKKLVENTKNKGLVNYNREVFYMDRKDELEAIFREIVNFEVELKNVLIDSTIDMDQLIISLK